MSTRRTDTHFYFWSDECPLSNWYKSPFEWKGNQFDNSEAAMMWGKAMLFGDRKIADIILDLQHPAIAKKKGRLVKGFDENKWVKWREKIVTDILLAKFTQSPELKAYLVELKGLNLVEASPYDAIWGVKLRPDDDRILNEKNWNGLNLLGKVLNDVQDKIITNLDRTYYGRKSSSQTNNVEIQP